MGLSPPSLLLSSTYPLPQDQTWPFIAACLMRSLRTRFEYEGNAFAITIVDVL
jgi:hypothetical protein